MPGIMSEGSATFLSTGTPRRKSASTTRRSITNMCGWTDLHLPAESPGPSRSIEHPLWRQ